MSSLSYRLCAFDLDDTLLGPTHEISPRNAAAVRAVAAKGVTVALSTGRIHRSAKRFADQLGLDAPIISYNGAMVRDSLTGETWFEDQVPADLAVSILDYCATHDLQLNWYLEDLIYTRTYSDWLRLYQRRTLAPVLVDPFLYDWIPGTKPTKVVIVDSLEVTNGLIPYFRAQFGESLYITKTTDEYLEFMPPTVNKGSALEIVATRLNVPQQSVVAFGDSFNDIPLLQWAGLGIAMENARPELRAVADRIAPRYDEDGVAIVLEELFGL